MTQPNQESTQSFSICSHPGVLIHLLDALAGTAELSERARSWLMLDPELVLAILRLSTKPDAASNPSGFAELCGQIPLATLKELAGEAARRLLARPEAAISETDWSRAIAHAHLCRALSERAAYPSLDEAWLAGLLCALPCGETALSTLPQHGELSAIPRLLRVADSRQPGAPPLLRLAAETWYLLETRAQRQHENLSPELPNAPESLAVALEEMDIAVETYTVLVRSHSNLAATLTRFKQVEWALAQGRDARSSDMTPQSHAATPRSHPSGDQAAGASPCLLSRRAVQKMRNQLDKIQAKVGGAALIADELRIIHEELERITGVHDA